MKKVLKGLLLVVLYSAGILSLFLAFMFLFDEDRIISGFVAFTILSALLLVPAIVICVKDHKKKKQAEEDSRRAYEEKKRLETEKERQWLLGEGKNYKKVIKNFWVNEVDRKLRIDDDYYDWKSIIGSQIISDDEVISTSVQKGYATGKRGSVGRAVAGGLLFGEVGAIVGANTGTQKTRINTTTTTTNHTLTKSLILRIFMDDVEKPYIDIPFIKNQISYDGTVEEQKEKINKCNGVIKIILNRNEEQ